MTTKSALLISITFMALMALLIEAHGIRVESGFVSSLSDRKDQEKNNINVGFVEVYKAGTGVVQCRRDEDCSSSSGRSRKLLTVMTPSTTAATSSSSSTSSTTTTSSAATTSKTEKNGEHMVEANKEKRGKLLVEPSSISDHPKEVTDHYPDILDIAGMDYSSAKRKPPIHN
ncbi:hypothetical protein Sjap_011042 [Stephania japonica]|uniref:Uncharacterized protein n=1 Tax=Stephania japonica TaxID=461633 RepID=A0AAP0P721_9MAGN